MLRFTLLLALLTSGLVAKPNLLIITVDDMSADSIGAFGCKLPGTTLHIDHLAGRSMRFQYAQVADEILFSYQRSSRPSTGPWLTVSIVKSSFE